MKSCLSGVTEEFLGYKVRKDGVQSCVHFIVRGIDLDSRRWLACLNPHSYVEARRCPAFARALQGANFVIPDGAGVILGSRILGGSIRERITGYDVFEGVCSALDLRGGRSVFFLGSTEDNLSAIRERMARDWPRVHVAGTYSPPFKPVFSDDDNEAMVEAINRAAPDVLWVGMSAPKQEKWIHANLSRLDVGFAAAIGAVFDFYSGRIRRSPRAFQRTGLEWLPRLAQEPRRLWRRTVVSAPIFLYDVGQARLGIKRF